MECLARLPYSSILLADLHWSFFITFSKNLIDMLEEGILALTIIKFIAIIVAGEAIQLLRLVSRLVSRL